MKSRPQSSDSWTIAVLVLLAIGSPSLFGLIYNATRDVRQTFLLTLLYIIIMMFVGLITGTWHKLSDNLTTRLASQLGSFLTGAAEKYRKSYLQFVVEENRTVDL